MSAVTQTLQNSLEKNKDSNEPSSAKSSQPDNQTSSLEATSGPSSDESMKTASSLSSSTPDSSFEAKHETFECELDSEFVYESSCHTQAKETILYFIEDIRTNSGLRRSKIYDISVTDTGHQEFTHPLRGCSRICQNFTVDSQSADTW